MKPRIEGIAMCEVIGTAIICGRPEKAFRVMVHCGWCDKKTRGLHEVVYGGYACNEYCGECGTVAYDHEYSGKVKSGAALERAEENILRVAAAWEQGGDQRDELEAYLSDLIDQSRKCFEEDSEHETKD